MALKLITGATVEPVSVEEAKLHLRVDITADDSLIRDLIKTAREDVETISQHALCTQTWDYFMAGFPGGDEIELPWPPLQSVTGIYYTEEGASESTFASANYYVDIYKIPGRVKLISTASWPTINVPQAANAVRVRFVAGFGAAEAVPYKAKQAILLLVGHYYENREAVFMGRSEPHLLPRGVTELCMDLRAQALRFRGAG